MDDNKKYIIDQAVSTGDWTTTGGLVTRDDLVEWIMKESDPDGKTKVPYVLCPVCGHNTKMYPVSLTHRHFKYLLNAIWLSDDDISKGGDGFVHHSVIHDRTINLMKYDKGKRKGKGIDFTAYSQITREPWGFLESEVTTNDKSKRNGFFRPTDRARNFCRGRLAVPDKIYILNKQVVRYSNKLEYCFNVKDVNFKQLLELYRTW